MSKLKETSRELYESILNDTRDASPRFAAMRSAFLKLAEQDLDDPAILGKNVSDLGRVLDFAKIYIRNHGGLHGSTKGKERYRWAKQLRNLTQDLYNRKKKPSTERPVKKSSSTKELCGSAPAILRICRNWQSCREM